MAQESVYVRTRDEPIWEKVVKTAQEKNVPQSRVVIVALEFFFREGDVDDVL